MFQLGDEHGRHAVDRRAALGLDGPERRLGVETLVRKDHRRAADRGAHRAQHAAKTMVERHGNADAVVGREPLTFGGVKGIQQQVAVAEQRPFGKAGRTGRVLQVDRIARLAGGRSASSSRCASIASPAASSSCQASIPGCSAAADADDPLQLRKLGAAEVRRDGRCPIPDRPPARDRNSKIDRCRSISAIRGLPTAPGYIRSSAARYDGLIVTRTTPMRAVANCKQHPLRPVRGPDAEMVSAPQPDCQQSAGDAIDSPVEFGPRHTDSGLGEDHRVAVGKALGRLPQRRADRETVDPRSRASPEPRALEEACQPAAAKVAEKQLRKYLAFPCQSRRAAAAEPFLDGGQELPDSDGPCRPRIASRQLPPARASAAQVRLRPSRRASRFGRGFAARRFFQPGGNKLLHAFVPPIRRPGCVDQSNLHACRAETLRPVSSIGNAASSPTNSGKRCVPPQAGNRPNLTSGRPSRVAIVIAGNAVAAGQCELQSAAQAWPVDHGHRRIERPSSRSKSFWPTITICSALWRLCRAETSRRSPPARNPDPHGNTSGTPDVVQVGDQRLQLGEDLLREYVVGSPRHIQGRRHDAALVARHVKVLQTRQLHPAPPHCFAANNREPRLRRNLFQLFPKVNTSQESDEIDGRADYDKRANT